MLLRRFVIGRYFFKNRFFWTYEMKIFKCKHWFNEILISVVLCFAISDSLLAQDLGPRFLSAAAVGMNFAIIAYTYSIGNVLLRRDRL